MDINYCSFPALSLSLESFSLTVPSITRGLSSPFLLPPPTPAFSAATSPSTLHADCADFSRCFLMGNSVGAAIAFHAAFLAAALPEPLDPMNIAGLVLDQPYFGGIKRTEFELRLKDDKIIPLPTNDLMWELALPEGADRDHEYSNPLKNEGKLFAGLRNFPRCMVRGHTGDPLFDRQREFARMLERRVVIVAASLESDGCHGVELFDPSKEEELVAEVKRFVCGEDGVATATLLL